MLQLQQGGAESGLHLVKVHAPWSVISSLAVELNCRAPIQVNKTESPSTPWSADIFSALCLPNMMDVTLPTTIPDYYSAPFRLDKVDMFLASNDKENFFSRSQRSRLVFEVLSNTAFGKERKGEIGIERLISEGAFTAAYPLHDVNTCSRGSQ